MDWMLLFVMEMVAEADPPALLMARMTETAEVLYTMQFWITLLLTVSDPVAVLLIP